MAINARVLGLRGRREGVTTALQATARGLAAEERVVGQGKEVGCCEAVNCLQLVPTNVYSMNPPTPPFLLHK